MVKINLTLDSRNCNLDGLTLFEPIDTDILDKLLRSDLLKNTFNNPICEFKFEGGEIEQLIKYKKLIKNGRAEIKYNKVKNMIYGRVNPLNGLGLFSIRRELRHTLAKDNFIDIDIENCHPVILYQICKTNNIDCDYDYLEEYVLNRQKYLDEVMTIYSVDKDTAKKLFIKLLYFGGFDSWSNKYANNKEATKNIIRFKKQIQEIGKIICENNEDIKKAVKKRKEEQTKKNYNEIGSVVSYYLQEIECRILETIYLYCVKNGIIKNNTAVLCADGLMILKENYNEELLNIFSDLIKKEYNLDLKFTQKEMNQDYLSILDSHLLADDVIIKNKMNGYDNNIIICENEFKYSELKSLFLKDIDELGAEKYIEYFQYTKSFLYFNNFHCYFYLSSKYYKIGEEIESYSDFLNAFNDLYFIHNKIKYKFCYLYDGCQLKNSYSKLDFKPNEKTDSDIYNLFKGFKYDSDIEYDIEIVKPFIEHIEFLCSLDKKDELSNYILNWMSHIIQRPETKTETALVFFSIVEGVGKNIVFDIFEKLLDNYSAKFKDTADLTSRFNGQMMGKLFCIGDEINARAQEVANELKDIITRKTEIIEFKGKDKIKTKDYKNYAFTTNNENVFKISNYDRRYLFIECPDQKRSLSYFQPLIDIINDDNKLRHLFSFLKNRDISRFNSRNIIITDYKLRLMLANAPSYIKFIKDEFYNYKDEYFTTEQLYKCSVDFAKRNKLSSTYTQCLFNKQFKSVFNGFNVKKHGKSYYYFTNESDIDIAIRDNFIQ